MARPRRTCPACKSGRVADIHYGPCVPTDEDFQKRVRTGWIQLRGCIVYGEPIDFKCRKCGHGWQDDDGGGE